MEEASQIDYNKAALECGANADAVTKQVFEVLIADEERHFDQYEKQMEKIRRFGPSYLALQSFLPRRVSSRGSSPGSRTKVHPLIPEERPVRVAHAFGPGVLQDRESLPFARPGSACHHW